MDQSNPATRYTSVAIALHWLIAAALGGMIALGKAMHDADHRPIEWMFQLHKSVGITILVLMIARLVWRLMNPPPPLPADMKPLDAKASHWVHIGLYALIFLLPLSGWIMVSASPFAIATVLYGTVSWPHLPVLPELALETREALYPNVEQLHEWLSWALIGLFVLHVAGAVKHEISDEEGVLKRMIPGLFGKTIPPRVPGRGALTAFGSAALFFGIIASGPVIAQSLTRAPVSTSPSLAANWAVDHNTSEIRFSGVHDGNAFSGVFEDWSADIAWTADTLESNAVAVTIATGSAVTGNSLYDNTMDAAEWFDINTFPSARVSLTNFRNEGDTFLGDAAISIKDISATVPFTFTVNYEDDTATMTGQASLARAAFNLGQESDSGGDWVSLDIDVSVTVNASRIAP